MAAALVTGAPLSKVPQAMDKKRRQAKKKSDLEENYPDYLMQAFYGAGLLTADRQNNNTNNKRRRKLVLQQQAFSRNRTTSQGSTACSQSVLNTPTDISEASSACDLKSVCSYRIYCASIFFS